MEVISVILNVVVVLAVGCVFSLKFIRRRNLTLLSWFWMGIALFYGFPGILIGCGLIDPKYSPLNYHTSLLGLFLLLMTGICVSLGFLFWAYITQRMKRGAINSFVASRLLSVFISILIIIPVIVIVWHKLAEVEFAFRYRHQVRTLLGMLGPMAILLQIPQGIALYWWNRYFSNMRKTNIFVPIVFLVIAGGVSFLRGQRTDLALVFIIPALSSYVWQKRRDVVVINILIVLVLIVLYSTMLGVFVACNNDAGHFGLVNHILRGDIDRNWTLWLVMEQASIDLSGSNVLPFPGAGYINAALAYVPRSIAPWKGHCSASWFTMFAAPILDHDPGARLIVDLRWGYSIGLPVEALINLGFLGLPLASLIFGAFLGVANNIAAKWKIWYPILAIIALFASSLSVFTLLVVHFPIVFTAVGLEFLLSFFRQGKKSVATKEVGTISS